MVAPVSRRGMTAVEVLASAILSALLMTALIGVLRGLKAHEQTLESREMRKAWQRSLDAALAADLHNAVSYELAPQRLTLRGHGGQSEDGAATWLPATIVYEVCSTRDDTWLVRRELPTPGGSALRPANLVMTGVTDISMAAAPRTTEVPDGHQESPPSVAVSTAVSKETPLPADVVLEFWGAHRREPLYAYRIRH